jgi:hypothetical protein
MRKEPQLQALIDRYGPKLPSGVTSELQSNMEHDEWGVALEGLCNYLLEYDVPIARADLIELKSISAVMGLDPGETAGLERLVCPPGA